MSKPQPVKFQDLKVKLSPFENAVSGAVGAMISNTIVYPLDTIKTRLQVQNPNDPLKTNYKGTMDAFYSILREEGVVEGLFRGLAANLVGTASSNFSYFFFYGWLRPHYEKRFSEPISSDSKDKRLSTFWELLLGSHAAALGQLFTIPVSVIVTRQQTSRPYKSFHGTLIEILAEDGLPGLWRGLAPSLILCINPAITFACFEKLKQAFARKGEPLKSWELFLMGAVAKAMATIVTYPYIMAKVRLQWKPKDTSNKMLVYSGVMDVLKKVYKQEGFSGLFNGLRAQILKAVLAQAFLFMIKDELDKYIWLISLALQKVVLST